MTSRARAPGSGVPDARRRIMRGDGRRDERNTTALAAAGWTVLRFWKHENPALVVQRLFAAVEP